MFVQDLSSVYHSLFISLLCMADETMGEFTQDLQRRKRCGYLTGVEEGSEFSGAS